MAHKTLIDGTAYEVKGGRCLVDGTAYGIKKGRTLADGTSYDVDFVGAPIPVTITYKASQAFGENCYALINGVKYCNSDATTEVFVGDVITFCIFARSMAGTAQRGSLNINGSVVSSVTSGTSMVPSTKEYEWTVPENTSAVSITLNVSVGSGSITVTTS